MKAVRVRKGAVLRSCGLYHPVSLSLANQMLPGKYAHRTVYTAPPHGRPMWPPRPCFPNLPLRRLPLQTSHPASTMPLLTPPSLRHNVMQHAYGTRSGRGAIPRGTCGSDGALHSSGWIGRGVHQASGRPGMGARTEKG